MKTWLRTIGVLIAVALVVGLVIVRGGNATEPKKVTAYFTSAVSVYVGTDVRILGVNVGKVTAVIPEGEAVRVEMEYAGEYKLPADAYAVIVTPTLVSDRFVQLTPVYTEGKVMADDAEIALRNADGSLQNAVPVELDRIYGSLRDLAVTLGPNGVNSDGTLNHLVKAAADALDGQGARGNQMLRNLAEAAQTFGEGSGDLFATVEQLATFSSTLAQNDRLVRAFISDLAAVSGQLADERTQLQETLAAVADAVGTVETFVKNNRAKLVTDVEKLTKLMGTIASEHQSLNDALNVAPVAIGNLVLAYNSQTGTVGSRIGVSGNVWDADGLLCSIVQQTDIPKLSKDVACGLFKLILEQATQNSPTLPPSNKAPAPGAQAPRTGVNAETSAPTAPDVSAYSGQSGPAPLSELLGGE